MSEIEFDESQLGNLGELALHLFDENPENDPRSLRYKRVLVRPKICWWRVILWCAVLAALPTATAFLGNALSWRVWQTVLAAIAVTLLYALVSAKVICLTLVRLYQRFAPEAVRRKCRFEPSCSQYMIGAIEKYGVWKGVAKGIDRLKRCNIHGGGFDEP